MINFFKNEPLDIPEEFDIDSTKITENLEGPPVKIVEVGADVYNDVEFFKSFSDIHPLTVFDKINTCNFQGSSDALRKILERPICHLKTLKTRQRILQNLKGEFDAGCIVEKEVLWLYEEVDPKLADLLNIVFFKFRFLKQLNDHPEALTVNNLYQIVVSPAVGFLTPLTYVVLPYLILSFKLKLKIPFKTYVSMMLTTMMAGGKSTWRVVSLVLSIFFYFQGIYNSVEISKTVYKISKFLVDKINIIVSSLKHAMTIIDTHWSDDIAAFLISKDLKPTSEEKAYVDQLQVLPFDLRSNFGKQLHTYHTINRDIIKSIMNKIYLLDALFCLKRFPSCQTEWGREFVLQDTYHPCISEPVPNSIKVNNIVLTGPNAGGKSTFIKSILINALLSQTAGIAVASRATMIPFSIINSQINIPDSKGYESLFEAEMYRCKAKLDQIATLPTDKKALFIMDEIFNSTNPVEGIAGAFAIANKLSQYSNCTVLFTTHYVYLTRLKNYLPYKMNVIQESDKISFPYKLSRGVSKQYIALDLLAKNGFDEGIIEEAQEIKRVLTKRQKSPENKNVQD